MWTNFYKERVNSSYQEYFVERYKPFLDKIVDLTPSVVLEEGCGIGSISKYLHSKNIKSCGFDIDYEMVKLAKANTTDSLFWKDNILHPTHIRGDLGDLIVTHGVLEHFSDIQIQSIFDRYKHTNKQSIHYVPLDKYHVPSYGDERLLPYEYWLELTGSTEYGLFNENYDMWFIK